MLKLNSIHLRNWCKTVEAQIDFQVDSSGAGKTSLGEAINRVFLGASLSTQISDYSLDWAGNTYVDARATLRGRPLRVELGYRCPEFDSDGEGLRFTFDGAAPVEWPRATQTRAELSALIGVSPEASLWTTFIDGDRLKFNRLSQGDALGLLMQALNQPPWDLYQERAKKRRDDLEYTVTQAAAKLEQLKANAEALGISVGTAAQLVEQENTAYQLRYSSYETAMRTHRASLDEAVALVLKAEEECKRIRKEIRAAEAADAEEFGKLELAVARLISEQRTVQNHQTGWIEHLAQCTAKLEHAETE